MQNAWFRKSRFKGGKGKKLNIGGGGLGYRERPGLGSENTVSPDCQTVAVPFAPLQVLEGVTTVLLYLSEFRTWPREECWDFVLKKHLCVLGD